MVPPVPPENRANPVPKECKVFLVVRDQKVLKAKRAKQAKWVLLDHLDLMENTGNGALSDLKVKKVNQESKEHQDLVVFPDQKDLKEVQATLDSRDPTVNLVSKDLKEKTAKMVLMVKREKQDLLVMLVLLVKWEPLGLLANLVPREQRVPKVALDCLVTKVTKVGPAFLVLLELLVTRESPDHKVLQDYEAHLEHRVTLVRPANLEKLATPAQLESLDLSVRKAIVDVADPKVIEENWVLQVAKVNSERKEKLD